MAGNIRAVQGSGWCDLISCEEVAGALGDTVNLKTEENIEFAVCDACLIRLSSADSPGELEELNDEVAELRTKIDQMEQEREGSS